MTFLASNYSSLGVSASVLIAIFASYVALDLAKRVRSMDSTSARIWWVCGSIAMATGIWSMHFVGMLSFSLPIELGYRVNETFLSWLAALAVSGIALNVASRGELTIIRLCFSAIAMGTGICAMHYIGMAALDMAPGIVWDMRWVALSCFIAVVASAAALSIFFWLRNFTERSGRYVQLLAAVIMGLAISGMHYSGMTAAQFPEGSVCLSADVLGGQELGGIIAIVSISLLGITLLSLIRDARMYSKAVVLTESLQTANEVLRRMALQDSLTGLANRTLFEDRLEQALGRLRRENEFTSPRHRKSIAVIFFDLDGFKPVNDSFGHATGDRLLKEVAKRLQLISRDSDTVARIGGDEFVMLIEGLSNITDATQLATRAIEAIKSPFIIESRVIRIGTSLGISHASDNVDGAQLLAHADAAMYKAKRLGGNCYVVFEETMEYDQRKMLNIQSDLRQAIISKELRLHYQPKIDTVTKNICGVEALLRWEHPQLGTIAPSTFIPIAERYGLICDLGNWVIEEVCRQMRAWDEQGEHIRVAINLSVVQLRQHDLDERIYSALMRNKIDPSRLLCEITESVSMDDIDATQRSLVKLRRIGVYLSIDDFGTGYSSLSYLRKLPARQIKIDRSFIQDLETSEDARAVVDAVIKLAHALDLRVVAEGVETEGQREILTQQGCDELQGFLLAKPMPKDDFLTWIKNSNMKKFITENI